MIVLLNGLSRSGKDTVAKYLSVKYAFEHIKISEKVKDVVSVMFDITKEELEDDRKDMICPDLGVTPRDMMKFIGTHVGQYELNKVLPDIGRCFWIKSAMKQMKEENKRYVISDYRFPHEYDCLTNQFPQRKIVVVKIVPEFSGFIPPQVIDETEMQLEYDYLLKNNTILQLHKDIDHMMSTISSK
jgi:dephospho-CoA kinase